MKSTTDELIHYFASSALEKNKIYRMDRYDVRADVSENVPTEQRLAYCCQNIIRKHTKYWTHNYRTNEKYKVNLFWWESAVRIALSIFRLDTPRISILHTNGCGDFMLIAKEHWFELRGYPEWEMYSFYLDSLLCHAAHHAGIREGILRDPMRIYHMEHSLGSGFSFEENKLLNERLALAGIPWLFQDEEDVRELLRHLKIGGRWIRLAYPKARWIKEGKFPFHEWGEIRDGEGTPWAEWYDLPKLLNLLEPAHFNVVLCHEFCEYQFIWFDLEYLGM